MLARPDVERARVTWHGERDLTCGRTQDRDVPVDRRHAIPGHGDVDDAVASEAGGGDASRSIERNQAWTSGQQDARSELPVTGPIRHAARGRLHAEWHQVAPHLFTGMCLDRQHLVPTRRQIHHAADDDRRRLRVAARGVESIVGAATRLAGRRISCGTGTASRGRRFARGCWTTTAPACGLRQSHRPRRRETRRRCRC